MHIVLHAGAHFTEEERLLKCLLRNRDDFARRGVAVPGPGKYRQLLRDMLVEMQENPESPNARRIVMEAILDDDTAGRVLLSHPHLLGIPRAIVRDGKLYPAAADRLMWFKRLFPNDTVELFIALRDPATFLPAANQTVPQLEMDDLLKSSDPRDLRWSQMLAQLRETVPDVAITTWCNEDAPLLWGQIVRRMVGLPEGHKILGAFDLMADIMSAEGMQDFRAYLRQNHKMNEAQKTRVMMAFLNKYAIQDAIEEEIDVPGWTEDYVAEITAMYDADASVIETISGVTFLQP
ncbi:MAG: hypothetical protein AAFV87_05760 [Pseudomonadota bacterium]